MILTQLSGRNNSHNSWHPPRGDNLVPGRQDGVGDRRVSVGPVLLVFSDAGTAENQVSRRLQQEVHLPRLGLALRKWQFWYRRYEHRWTNSAHFTSLHDKVKLSCTLLNLLTMFYRSAGCPGSCISFTRWPVRFSSWWAASSTLENFSGNTFIASLTSPMQVVKRWVTNFAITKVQQLYLKIAITNVQQLYLNNIYNKCTTIIPKQLL